MPQATNQLRRKFPNGDREALDVIEANFFINRGGFIQKKDPKYQPTDREFEAIDYLFQEWDYGYSG